jgi:hypothetical protein
MSGLARIRTRAAIAISTPVVAAATLWALPFGQASQPRRLELPVLGPQHAVPGKHASVVLPHGWERLPSRPEGAVVRFRCYTAAMFAYLPWTDQGTRITIDRASRRAEAYRNGVGLALTYDIHQGCAPADHRKATEEVLQLLKSFR